jgi:hypothetical protein
MADPPDRFAAGTIAESGVVFDSTRGVGLVGGLPGLSDPRAPPELTPLHRGRQHGDEQHMAALRVDRCSRCEQVATHPNADHQTKSYLSLPPPYRGRRASLFHP